MHTSGLILDVYDDVGGDQLKSFFPTREDIPGFVKQAQALSGADRNQLPDDAFALVLVNGDEKLRKYACIDEGNTALSVLYFIKNAHKLPDEAREVVAGNLKIASGWYGLDVPEELEKEAVGVVRSLGRNARGATGAILGAGKGVLGGLAGAATAPISAAQAIVNPLGYVAKNPVNAAMTAMTLPGMARSAKQGVQQNLQKLHAGERAAGTMGGMSAFTPHGVHEMTKTFSANLEYLKLSAAFKNADVAGTNLMPISKDAKDGESHSPAHTIKKTSTVGRLVQGHRGEQSVFPEVADAVSGKAPVKAPQHMNPVVEVTGKEPHKEETEKKAQRFALPSYGRYPLDNYGQVKQAAAYFEEYGRLMPPVDRHEFCVNLTKRAEALMIPVSDTVRKYGSEKYASAHELEAALDTRRQLLQQDDITLLDKIASAAPTLMPDDFAYILEAFDQSRGLHNVYDSHVMDPYYSTYGFEKKAEDQDDWSDIIGNYQITAHELKACALNQWLRLQKQFGIEFADEFKKDPIAIYKSMPVEQKKLIIRIATENAPA
jgi:hypothetical protein